VPELKLVNSLSPLFPTPSRTIKKDFSVNDLYYWIALRLVFGVGNVNYKNLIYRFGAPENVFQADPRDIAAVEGVSGKAIEAIRQFKPSKDIDSELEHIHNKNIAVITLTDPAYPANLKNIYDPPPFLYVRGTITPQDDTAVAIVGSRVASDYGSTATERISRELAHAGITIVSGMARGIDSTAHHGALSARGRTFAVLGSGIDIIYPPENRQLYASIAEHGAVFSEFPMGTKPHAYNFPARNRIISGLSLGVLVVEASLNSGSLITAQLALEQGRDVFAVPGNVHSYKSKGTHKLLKEGAKLVESAQDILEEIRGDVPAQHHTQQNTAADAEMSAECRTVYHVLTEEPLHIDEVILKTGFSSSHVSSLLLELELNGMVKQVPGKRFIKSPYP
jgi:DNA processing protein